MKNPKVLAPQVLITRKARSPTMKSTITSETLMIKNKEYTLTAVSGSPCSFGICDTTKQREKGIQETLFVGHEALVNVIQRSINDCYSNKIIAQNSSMERCGDFPRRVAAACEDYYIHSKNVVAALQPLLDYIKNGLYVIYEQEMIPTDGMGNYFWTAYMVGHELVGSSTFNSVCKKQHSLPPPFLVPTDGINSFSEKQMKIANERVKTNGCAYGICMHLSGMFCALLSNHYDVTAALMQDKKIKCLVIEPIRYFTSEAEMRSFDSPQEKDEEESETEQRTYENCLYTCCANIPMSSVPAPLLETFFLTRKNEIGKYSATVSANSEHQMKIKSRRSMPEDVVDKCDTFPDCEMLQSAALVSYLSDEELNTLLNGETMLNDKYIINQNYYSSITIAFNYLQHKDFGRFISFASAIMQNEALTAVHQYAAARLQSIMDERVLAIFDSVLKNENEAFIPVKTYAERYIKRYEQYKEKTEMKKEAKKATAAPVIKRDPLSDLESLKLSKAMGNK